MFNSPVLDVVIGLVFIYLLYSLLATVIQELWASLSGLRASILEKGISRMLDDNFVKPGLLNKIISGILGIVKAKPKPDPKGKVDEEKEQVDALSVEFYKHPLIKYLGENTFYSKPSYLTAQNFSKVFIDLLRGADAMPGQDFKPLIQGALTNGITKWGNVKISSETLSYLKTIWADSQGDVDKFRGSLEQWFDDTMERASGWYKRRTQLYLCIIGLILAGSFNIDTISIAGKLAHDPRLAAQMANNASIFIQNHQELGKQLASAQQDSPKPDAKKVQADMSKMLEKSTGLLDSAYSMSNRNIAEVNQVMGLGWSAADDNFGWLSIPGWLITALAISLGAPFWFDLLNKLMKLRSSVAASSTTKSKPQNSKPNDVKRNG